MSVTIDRLASLIQRELASIVNEEVKDKSFGYINLTDVKVTKDMSYATVYYTILKDEKDMVKKSQDALEDVKTTIRMQLAKRIRNVRKIPQLIFKFDEALAYGNHIDDILKTLK